MLFPVMYFYKISLIYIYHLFVGRVDIEGLLGRKSKDAPVRASAEGVLGHLGTPRSFTGRVMTERLWLFWTLLSPTTDYIHVTNTLFVSYLTPSRGPPTCILLSRQFWCLGSWIQPRAEKVDHWVTSGNVRSVKKMEWNTFQRLLKYNSLN